MNNIVLIGYRGVGKSTIGKLLASKLNNSLVSLDNVLREKVGDLQAFIKTNGWDKFRDEETNVIMNLGLSHHVIDTGGGVVEREENIKALQKIGVLVYIEASAINILKRLQTTHIRLSLVGNSPTDEIETVLARRHPLYVNAADIVINTDMLTVDETVHKIIDELALLQNN